MLPFRELRPTAAEIREMIRLASPVVLAQVGIMLMGVVDTAMVGRVSADAVAAVALGHIYWVNLSIPGIGLLMALDPVVSQAVGAADRDGVRRGVQRGAILACAITVPVMLLLMPGEVLFAALRQPESVAPTAASWARWSALGSLPFFLFVAFRQSLQAMGTVRPVVIAIVAGNLLNIALNWVLIYGHLGAPAMGAVGSSVSTVIGRWAMLVILVWTGRHHLVPALRPWQRESWRLRPLGRMLAIGAPVALQQWLEVAVFAAGAVVIGWFGAKPLAAHEIAINLAATTFMVPLGLSAAAAAMVGRAIGRGDMAAARRDAVAAIAVGLGFMTIAAVIFLAVPDQLATMFVADAETRAVAAALLAIAGVFQVFDGVQGVATGVLRGTADTTVPMFVHLAGFWLLGAPAGLWLAFRAGYGPRGVWFGYVVGLALVSAALLWRVRWRLARDISRLHIDEHPSALTADG